MVKCPTRAKVGWFIFLFLMFALVVTNVPKGEWGLQNTRLHIFLGFVFYSCIMGFGPPNAGEIKEHFVGLFGVSFLCPLFLLYLQVRGLCNESSCLCSIKCEYGHIIHKVG